MVAAGEEEVDGQHELTSMEYFLQLQRSSYPSLQTDIDGMQVDGCSRRGRGERLQQERTLVMGAAAQTDVDGILFQQLLSVASN